MAQSRLLRKEHDFEEFKRHYGKTKDLTVLHNVTTKNGVPVHLILDPKCLEKYKRGNMMDIHLHPVLEYQCCEHVLYGRFTCNDHNFFVRAKGYGTPVGGSTCPFHDGGRGISDSTI
jgi:hypothetical protein